MKASISVSTNMYSKSAMLATRSRVFGESLSPDWKYEKTLRLRLLALPT